MIDAPNHKSSETSSPDVLRVSDVMGPVVSIAPDATLREVAQLMLQQQVQVVLVVDSQSYAIGIVTERQIAFDDRHLTLAGLRAREVGGCHATRLDDIDAACAAATSLTARDVMDRRPSCADVNERLGAVVQRMNRREAEFAVVHEGSNVVGVLGRHDLLRRVTGESRIMRAPAPIPHVKLGTSRRSWFGWLTGAYPY